MNVYDRLIQEYGFIPTEKTPQWRESLTEDQKTVLDEYIGRLMMDAQDIEEEMNDEA